MSLIQNPLFRAALVLLSLRIFFGPLAAVAQPAVGVPVEVDLVRERAIERVVHLTGTVTSARSARLSASTAGLVTVLHVDSGSQVAQGDLLLEMDPELARWQWESAQASADAALIALEDARRRLAEARTLAPQRSIAETVVLDLAAEVAEDDAALKRARAEAGYRKGVLERHLLRAPFAGVISARHTELGEWVNPGQAVLELVATGELRIDFPVAEDYLADIGADTPVSYTLGRDATGGSAGKVATVVPVTDPDARTFLLRVHAAEPDPRMKPGMSARAELKLDTGRRGLVVPRDAILKYPDGRVVVWVVESVQEGATVTERLVEPGLVFDGLVEVRSGLQAGVRVVVQGNETLQVGQRVSIQPRSAD